jgi:putative Mg2+ transporter-C (MgtC) family protein
MLNPLSQPAQMQSNFEPPCPPCDVSFNFPDRPVDPQYPDADIQRVDWAIELQIVIQVLGAMILGGLIGLEREFADKPAGLRTHMLVAGTAALLVSLARPLIAQFDPKDGVTYAADPIRIVQAIILGIGFLGAGTIIRGRAERTEGLTTGATLLLAAALGISVAAEQFILAVGVTVLTLAVLILLGHAERWLAGKRRANSGSKTGK